MWFTFSFLFFLFPFFCWVQGVYGDMHGGGPLGKPGAARGIEALRLQALGILWDDCFLDHRLLMITCLLISSLLIGFVRSLMLFPLSNSTYLFLATKSSVSQVSYFGRSLLLREHKSLA